MSAKVTEIVLPIMQLNRNCTNHNATVYIFEQYEFELKKKSAVEFSDLLLNVFLMQILCNILLFEISLIMNSMVSLTKIFVKKYTIPCNTSFSSHFNLLI